MNSYRSSAELKASAKEHMFGHYGTAISAYLLVTFTTGIFSLMVLSLTGDTTTLIGTCIYIAASFALSVLTGLFTSGVSYFYLKISCGLHVTANDVFYGFRFYPDKALRVQAWVTLIAYIGNIPEYIMIYRMPATPGTEDLIHYLVCTAFSGIITFIINLFYAQAFFLLHDFPQYSASELLAASRKVMTGHKCRLFYLYISFIPLMLLSLLSCGIAMLWITPYMNATLTEFYLDLIQKRQ